MIKKSGFLPPVTQLYDIHTRVYDSSNLQKTEHTVEITNEDTFLAANRCLLEGYHPVVLNMCSNYNPGGGFLNGARAQEEELCRRSNLYPSLIAQKGKYPLNLNCLYTPDVTVFRGHRYEPITPFKVGVISAAAQRHPIITKNGQLEPRVRESVRLCIQHMFDVAMKNGHDCFIGSAWGCGAYGNPPYDIATLFKEVLESNKYRNTFKKVVFAIIDYGTHNGEIFESVLGGTSGSHLPLARTKIGQ